MTTTQTIHEALSAFVAANPLPPHWTRDEPPKTYGCHHMADSCRNCEAMVKRWKVYWGAVDALAELEKQEPVAWRPISTAPRNGTNILLRFGQDGVSQGKFVLGAIGHPWKFIDSDNGITWLTNHAVDGPGGPSHWMPMPDAAPVAQQPQAEPLCEDEGCPHSGTKHVCISPPQAEAVPDDVGQLEYCGNSVSYIHQKMTAYRGAIDAAWQAMRDAGHPPDGRTPLAQAITKALAPQQAKAVPTNCTECRNADSWGMPDQPVCRSCRAGSAWEPLNKSSVNPNKKPQAEVVWVNPELEHMAEEAECVSMCLNDRGVPSKDGSEPLSLWGRVEQYANPRFLEGMTTNTPIVSSEHIKALAKACRLIGNYATAEFVQNVVGFVQVLLANKAVQEAFVKANTHLLYAAPQQAKAVPPTHVLVPVELLYRVLDSEELNAMADASDELRAMLAAAPKGQQP